MTEAAKTFLDALHAVCDAWGAAFAVSWATWRVSLTDFVHVLLEYIPPLPLSGLRAIITFRCI